MEEKHSAAPEKVKLRGFGAFALYLFVMYTLLQSLFLFGGFMVADPSQAPHALSQDVALLIVTGALGGVSLLGSIITLIILWRNAGLLPIKIFLLYSIAFGLFEFASGLAIAARFKAVPLSALLNTVIVKGLVGALLPAALLIFILRAEQKEKKRLG